MRAVLLGVWLAVIAVAISTEVEEAEGTVSTEGKLYEGIPKDDLPKMTIQGIRNMDLWKIANDDAITTNNKLEKRLSTPWKTKAAKDCCAYHKIPWFKLGFMGKRAAGKSKSGCKALCNQYMACKSFSYNFNDRDCIWSPQSVTYDQDWRFYSKKKDLDGKPDGTYHMFPGMKFMEPTTDIEKGKSQQECMYGCTQELGCNSFSYSEPRAECARSGQEIGYSEHWHYWEKDEGNGKPEWVEKHEKENKEKDKLKKDYINDIDRLRTKEKMETKQENQRKADIEMMIKKDGKAAEKSAKDSKRDNEASERKKKTAGKMKESEKKFGNKMQKTTIQMDNLEKNDIERLQKRIVDTDDTSTKSQLSSQLKGLQGQLKKFQDAYAGEKQNEKGVKDQWMKADQSANTAAEVAEKDEQKKRSEEFKLKLAQEEGKMAAEELANKDCGKSQKKQWEKVAEARRTEKQSKSKLANEEGQVQKWFRRAKTETNELNKKRYEEVMKEAKESLNKVTQDEQLNIQKKDDEETKLNSLKEKCDKKAAKKKADELKIKKSEVEIGEKRTSHEESEKRSIKEQSQKMKESDVKEAAVKEHGMKESHSKAKREKTRKEQHLKEGTVKEKKRKVEIKTKETTTKEAKYKDVLKNDEKRALEIKEASYKTKVKEELEFKEKYFKEDKAKESAEKDSNKMTKEVNEKEAQKATDREQAAMAAEAAMNKRVAMAADEKESKEEMEMLSKAEEKTLKSKMKRPHLQAVRRNDAGVIKVPAPGGTMMVGGGIINHYRKWNGKSIFEESYPDGDNWRCDTGVADGGQATCISLSYKMPEGTKCTNARVYTANAGVIHATLPPGYLMVSGGVQNLHRRFDRHSAFEESMPAGDRKWRCDMGYGRGELNCFVRGCKFPHGAHCVTTEGSSNNAGWVWAECPEGYVVTGCGMRNNYLHFDVKSGFEDLRPIGNKCMGDMGFGPGRVSVFARCCNIEGPPPEIPAPPPPAKPGTANPDNVACLSNMRWEKREATDCQGGDYDEMPVQGGNKQEALAQCSFKCSQKHSCTGFSFPTDKGGESKCKLKKGEEFIYSEEYQKFCDSETPTDKWDSYAKLHDKCQKATADSSKMVKQGTRPVKINEETELGEARKAPKNTGSQMTPEEISAMVADKVHSIHQNSDTHASAAKDDSDDSLGEANQDAKKSTRAQMTPEQIAAMVAERPPEAKQKSGEVRILGAADDYEVL